MTVSQAARIAEVSPSNITDWRAGRAPTDFAAIRRLSKALGVSMTFLLTGDNENEIDGNQINAPTVTQIFKDGGLLYDGFARVTIQKLTLRTQPLDSGIELEFDTVDKSKTKRN